MATKVTTKDRSLKKKAIDIKGKKYVLISDRLIYFNSNFPNGRIETQLKSEVDAEMVVVKAKIIPDTKNTDRYFTGYSQAKWGVGAVNKTSAIENCETSAVGRALGMMGIGVIDSVASADEVRGATLPGDYKGRTYAKKTSSEPATATTARKVFNEASEAQRKLIFALGKELGLTSEKTKEIVKVQLKLESFTGLTKKQASIVIDKMQGKAQERKPEPEPEPEGKEEFDLTDEDLGEIDKETS